MTDEAEAEAEAVCRALDGTDLCGFGLKNVGDWLAVDIAAYWGNSPVPVSSLYWFQILP